MVRVATQKNNTLTSSEKKYYELFIFAVLTFQFLVLFPGSQELNPWVITPYFMSYQDLGFNSRFLIGSILKLFSEYISTAAIYTLVMAVTVFMNAFITVVLGRFLRNCPPGQADSRFVFVLLFLASPFSLSFLYHAENFGRFELYLIIITVFMLLIVRHKFLKWLIPFLCFAAVAIHQAYAMTYMPAIAIVLIYEAYKNKWRFSNIALTVSTYAVIIISTVYFQFFVPDLNFSDTAGVVEHLSHRTDFKLNSNVIFIEHFANINTWFQDELKILRTFLVPYTVSVLLIAFPLIAIFITLWLTAMKTAKDRVGGFIPFLCLTAPLASLPMFIGNDWDRWISAMFITQFSLAFYLIDAGFLCISKSAETIAKFFKKNRLMSVIILLFLSFFIFSTARLLFFVLQTELADFVNEGISEYKEALANTN